MNNDSRHIPALDGIRGFAALMVFFVHYGGGQKSSYLGIRLIAKGLVFGWTGVSLFFVLSGFLISGILWDSMGKKHWWKRFYLRRSLRIFPLYYFSILLIFSAAVVFKGTHWRLESLVPFMAYLQNIPWTSGLRWKFPYAISLSHFWSLAVEEQFYLIWPFLLLLVRNDIKQARRMCCCVWLLSLAYRVAVVYFSWNLNWAAGFLLGRSGDLAAGAWLALAVRGGGTMKHVQRFSSLVLGLSSLSIISVILLARSTEITSPYILTVGISFVSLFFVSLLAMSLNPSLPSILFSNRVLRWMGKISYGFYVYQVLLLPLYEWIVARSFPVLGWNSSNCVLAAVAFGGTIAAASLSYYGFEKHFLVLKDRFSV